VRYHNYVDSAPTVESFRLSHTPRPGLGIALIMPWVVVTGQTGTTYQFLRGYGLPERNTVLNFGVYRGTDELDKQAPLLIPFSEHPPVEPLMVTEDDEAVTYSTRSHELRLGVKGFDWRDANGRVNLHAELLGRPCAFWIPEQDGVQHPLLSRSHFGRVRGTIDGDQVDGIWMHDHIYSRPSLSFLETDFTRVLHNYWMNWLVEYDDGSVEGGYAWRGRPGTGFAAAHHYTDGVSTARTDARLTFSRTERGSIDHVTLQLGRDLTVEFAQHGSLDWPIHTYGSVVAISREKAVRRSWNYTEFFPSNWGLVEDYQLAHAKLFGRYPSLQRMLEQSHIADDAIVFAR
jgi:hypothetical protein